MSDSGQRLWESQRIEARLAPQWESFRYRTKGSERSVAIWERLVWDPMVPSMSLDFRMSVRAQESIVVNMQSFSKDRTCLGAHAVKGIFFSKDP